MANPFYSRPDPELFYGKSKPVPAWRRQWLAFKVRWANWRRFGQFTTNPDLSKAGY